MPCWAKCMLGYWWIWGIGSIVAAAIGFASAGGYGAVVAGLGWFAATSVAIFIRCVIKCKGFH